MPTRCRSLALLAALALASLVPGGATSAAFEPAGLALPAGADQTTALPLGAPLPVGAMGLGPGTFLLIDIGGSGFVCTANWVWRDGGAYFLGAAGHCFLGEGEISTHGADSDADTGTVRVRACVAHCELAGSFFSGQTVALGEVVYARQTRAGLDIGNDFGLVRIPDALLADLRPALPVWGAASGTKDLYPGEPACLYGNGVGVGETYATKARIGPGIVTLRDGSWRAALPSAPGDSGSGVATCAAGLTGTRAVAAVGVLTHLSASGVAGTTMARAVTLASEAGLAIEPVL